MKIYISGRISGRPIEEARAQFEGACDVVRRHAGNIPVNPFDNGLPDDAPWIDHILADLKMLHECDAIYMLEGWRESTGATIEWDFARRTGKQIHYEGRDEHFSKP